MNGDAQISVRLSRSTRELLDRYVKATGAPKGRVIEMALLHHLRAIEGLPADVVVSPRVVVSARSWRRILKEISSRKPPSRALRWMRSV